MSATPGATKSSAADFALRTVKLGISVCWFGVSWGWCLLCQVLGRRKVGTGVVLYYHSVPRDCQSRFERQMETVVSQIRPIAVSGIDSLPEGTYSVAITFDDGLESFVEHAIPVLQRFNIPATAFVVADALGTKPAWGESYYDPEERVMSEEQLRGLPDLISVGSHTLTHPHLENLSVEASAREITESRKKLELLLRRPVTTFSFPHGEFNHSAVSQCWQAGYERVFTINPTLLRSDHSEFVVGRVAADPWDWQLEFKLKIMGGYCWQSYLHSAKQWIKRLFSWSGAVNPPNSWSCDQSRIPK